MIFLMQNEIKIVLFGYLYYGLDLYSVSIQIMQSSGSSHDAILGYDNSYKVN